MGKLIYEKYKGSNDVLKIDLGNGYSVLVIKFWKREERGYLVEFYLIHNASGRLYLMEEAITFFSEVSQKDINPTILREVANLNVNGGVVAFYIDQHKYEMKCFDIGEQMLRGDE